MKKFVYKGTTVHAITYNNQVYFSAKTVSGLLGFIDPKTTSNMYCQGSIYLCISIVADDEYQEHLKTITTDRDKIILKENTHIGQFVPFSDVLRLVEISTLTSKQQVLTFLYRSESEALGGEVKQVSLVSTVIDQFPSEHSPIKLDSQSPATIRDYFEKIYELKKSGEEFPVNLDDVWPLVYKNRKHAIDELVGSKGKSSVKYLQDVDYQASPEIRKAGPGSTTYFNYLLSLPCLEYFVARKVREVFEVYREVFHRIAEQTKALKEQFVVPKSLPEALRLYADSLEENEKLQIENQLQEVKIVELKPKAEIYDRAMKADGYFTIEEVAKILNYENIGRNKLYQILREGKVLMKSNLPYQEDINSGYCKVVQKFWTDQDGDERTNSQVMISQKGIAAIKELLDKVESVSQLGITWKKVA